MCLLPTVALHNLGFENVIFESDASVLIRAVNDEASLAQSVELHTIHLRQRAKDIYDPRLFVCRRQRTSMCAVISFLKRAISFLYAVLDVTKCGDE